MGPLSNVNVVGTLVWRDCHWGCGLSSVPSPGERGGRKRGTTIDRHRSQGERPQKRQHVTKMSQQAKALQLLEPKVQCTAACMSTLTHISFTQQ